MKTFRAAAMASCLMMAPAYALAQGGASTPEQLPEECARIRSTFDRDDAVYAAQKTEVPLSIGTLEIRPGANGGVKVEPGSADRYLIVACVAVAADSQAEAQQAVASTHLSVVGNRVGIEHGDMPARWHVHLIVKAPRGAELDIETANGPVSMSGIDGTFAVRASNGPIAVEDVSGRLQALAVNGPISVSGSGGEVSVKTQNGPIAVTLRGDRWDGSLEARAENGPLSVRVPDSYASGVQISSSSRSPWNCRVAACQDQLREGTRTPRSLRLGHDPVVVQVSTANGPVSVQRAR